MVRVDLFCEDAFHEIFVGSLIRRVAAGNHRELDLRIRSSTGGIPSMKGKLKDYLRDLAKEKEPRPHAVIVVVDANCLGYNERKKDIGSAAAQAQLAGLIHYAIPDPHIERWMLVDPAAFNAVFGRGCTLPASKCARDEYKRHLRREIRLSGREAPLGGREFAEDIVAALDLDKAYKEPSLRLFIQTLRKTLQMLHA